MIINKKTFINSDLEKNSNKFWIITQYDNGAVETHYGRVGETGQKTTKNFSSTYEAEKFFNKKVSEKQKIKTRRDAYTEIHILDDKVITHSSNKHISDLAAEQIETSSDEVRKLVKWFSDINIHKITSNTQLQYNMAEGCFRTPLGVVDSSCIKNAKALLEEISQFPDRTDKDCVKKINMYLRMIPQDLGKSSQKIQINNIFGTGDLLQKQADIIEGLEAAISSTSLTTSHESQERVFNTKLDICTDVKVIEELKSKFSSYASYNRINCVYEVTIKDVNDRFVNYGQKIGNVNRLWHGTNPINILSIFKYGLQIPKNYTNGRRFLDGVYFSDKSSMSLNYAPYQLKDGKKYQYLFVSDVAMGNYYEPDSYYRGLPKGYDSCWAEKQLSSSQVIVYDTNQINLCYLVELMGV